MHAAPRDSEHDTLKCTSRHDTSTVSAFVETLSAFMNMRTQCRRFAVILTMPRSLTNKMREPQSCQWQTRHD